MRRSHWVRCWFTIALALSCGTVPGRVAGEEATLDFLEALRRQGYHAEALDYLEQMRGSPLAPRSFQETIDFEAGVTLIQLARAQRTLPERERLLAEAKQKLARFVSEHPEHFLAAGAQTQLANVLVEHGRIKVEQAAALGTAGPQRLAALELARALFREAEAAMAESDKKLGEAVKKFGFVKPDDAKRTEERDQVRREQLQAQLARVWVRFELARTFDAGTDEHKAGLNEAAKQFAELYVKHGERLVGLYALLGQGRCLAELGETQKAFDIFEGLLAWPDEPESFRVLKSEALSRLLEIALGPAPVKSKDALRLHRKWTETARQSDQSNEAGLTIHYLAGEVALAFARTLKEDDLEQARLRDEALRVARESLALVAGCSGPHQAKAKVRLLDPLVGGKELLDRKPTNFAEARDRAKAALHRLAEIEANAASAGNPADVKSKAVEMRREALEFCQLAMKLRTTDVPADDLRLVRYYMAYLQLKAGNFAEAALLGENLARQEGDGEAAREGAKIALAAYDAMARAAAPGDRRQSATARLLAMAEHVVMRWGGRPEADEARIILLQAALNEERLERAAEYLQQIPPGSARRGEAELCVGQAMWTSYLRAMSQPEGQRPSLSRLEKTAAQARQYLNDGIERARPLVERGGEVSPVLAAAVLSLAQICLGTGQAEKAVALLDDPKIGAKTLVDAHHPLTQQGNYDLETCRVALRAYVATRQFDRAQAVMGELEELVKKAGGGESDKRLTQTYISLGRDLQKQFENLRAQGKTEELPKIQEAFELFLTEIARRKEGNTFQSLHWVAEMFWGMGAGFDPGGMGLPPQAEKYYRKAADVYRTVLDRSAAEKQFAPRDEALITVQIRLARCLRRLGEHPQALELLLRVLRERGNMVDAQVEAAYVYQEWGDEKPEYYELAIAGSPRHKEIWGWGLLARKIQGISRYREVFHEARYNLALCRFRQGQLQTSAAQREKLLRVAEDDILAVQRIHPDMGGKLWYDKYNELLKRIQRLRNQTPAGLPPAAS